MKNLESSESAFAGVAPVLLGVLRRLAAQGYAYSQSDTLDILHDFYLDEWDSVLHSYDPNKGPLAPYASRAFARYARRWLIRSARLRSLIAISDAGEALYTSPEADTAAADLSLVRAALAALRQEDRSLLLGRFAVNPASERELALELGLSRHRIRERLLEALSELAMRVGDDATTTKNVLVLKQLFVEKSPIPWIANEFGLTETQVKRLRRRFLQTMQKALQEST